MIMHRIYCLLLTIIAIFGSLVLGDVTIAAAKAAKHHDAKALIGDKLKTDGRHDIDKKGNYTTSVEARHGKIAAVHVRHVTKGEVPVKKYKTNRKMAQSASGHIVYASMTLSQDQDLGTVYLLQFGVCARFVDFDVKTGARFLI